jgi:hypothetical protein
MAGAGRILDAQLPDADPEHLGEMHHQGVPELALIHA